MIKHMPFPNTSYKDPINRFRHCSLVMCWNVVNNTVGMQHWDLCFSCWKIVSHIGRWNQVEIWKHCRWLSPKQNMLTIRALFTEAASTSTATHWCPAVQHWSLCVFWCTGPECDVISLLRQKRQARSPPSGHWPLSWTWALYAIIAEWLRQTGSVAYGKSKSRRKKLWSQELGREHTSVKGA